MHLGKSLKIALVTKGIKNKDLAEHLGIYPEQVSAWISSGNMNHVNLLKICQFLELKVSEFVALSED